MGKTMYLNKKEMLMWAYRIQADTAAESDSDEKKEIKGFGTFVFCIAECMYEDERVEVTEWIPGSYHINPEAPAVKRMVKKWIAGLMN